MDIQFAPGPVGRSVGRELRALAVTWAIAGMLPLPMLVATDPDQSAFISCLYLGLASAWLVAESHRLGGAPGTSRAWRARTLAICAAVATNVAAFVSFGIAADVRTQFPFPLMAVLSAAPAVGLVPWLVKRVHQPYSAIVLSAVLVLAAKLAACVVARVVYGPDFLAQGYVAADWRSAKLMICLFWILSTALSTGFFVADAIDRRPCGVGGQSNETLAS